jgi:subtilisin-like proprotein convertase family protein
MKFNSFARFFGTLWRNKPRTKKGRSQKKPDRLRARLLLEALEDRAVPATTTLMDPALLPPAVVNNHRVLGDGHDPQIAMDPTNPQRLVVVTSVYNHNFVDPNQSTYRLEGHYTSDGGHAWQPLDISLPQWNLNIADQRFQFETDPSVAFDRFGSFYIASVQHDPANTSGQVVFRKFDFSGSSPTAVPLAPSHVRTHLPYTDQVLYNWIGTDPAFNPHVAIDNNQPTFTDPDTGVTQTDLLATPNTLPGGVKVPQAIYVAWNTNYIEPNGVNPRTWSRVKVAASADGGQTFSSEQVVSGDLFEAHSPQLAFTQGSVDIDPLTGQPRVRGGQLTFTWATRGARLPNGDPDVRFPSEIIVDRSFPNEGDPLKKAVAAQQFTFPGGTILDPLSDPAPVTTTFAQTITIDAANFTTLTDLDVTVAIFHASMNQVLITLTPPASSGVTTPIVLLENKTTAAGADRQNIGVTAQAHMGLIAPANHPLHIVGTVFDDDAHRVINDPTAATPWIGHFVPEGGSLSVLDGKTAAQLSGTWTLSITDFRDSGNPPPPQFLDFWGLHFSGNINGQGFGDGDSALSSEVEVGAFLGALPHNGPAHGTPNGDYPLKPAVSPHIGIGPGAVIAVDNTLGSFSPFQGRMYIAYNHMRQTQTDRLFDVRLMRSDDAGRTWSFAENVHDDVGDNFSDGNREQYMPALAVDQATGTVVVTYRDARYDPARVRLSNSIQTSIDGGVTFSESTFLNESKTATDMITRQVVTLESIPDNQSEVPTTPLPRGFGDKQGLVVYGGKVYPVWGGNQNFQYNPAGFRNPTGSAVQTAYVTIAAGPRIIKGDMGHVVGDFHTGGNHEPYPNSDGKLDRAPTFDYNNTYASDGTRRLDGFVVRFDRPVDPLTFTPADVTVWFRDPTNSAGQPGTELVVAEVAPLDGNVRWGPARAGGANNLATEFFIRLATPQSAIGTYSYSVGPEIRDRIRTERSTIIPHQTATNSNTGHNNTYAAPPAQINKPINPGQSPAVPTVTTSTLTVGDIPANRVLRDLTVNLTISHYDPSLLRLELVSPTGVTYMLSDRNPFPPAESNFINTTFDDQALVAITDANPAYNAPYLALPPFNNSFRLQTDPFTGEVLTPLRSVPLTTAQMNGTWTLKMTYFFRSEDDPAGNLLNWSIRLQAGESTAWRGNYMDQNQNAWTADRTRDLRDAGDFFNVPGTVHGVPLRLPYEAGSLPVILPGPHVAAPVFRKGTPTLPANELIPNATRVEGVTIPGVLVSELTVGNLAPELSLSKVRVEVDIDHPDSSTLTIYLIAPNGQKIKLNEKPPEAQRFNTGPDYNHTNFDDGAAESIAFAAPQFRGVFRPLEPLHSLYGINPNGVWKLQVEDHIALDNFSGVLRHWNLTIETEQVTNRTASFVDVRFDRDLNTFTFKPENVLRMIGPAGAVAGPFTVTANPPGTPANLAKRTFRIGFPTQQISGTYTLVFGPDSQGNYIQDGNGNKLDVNLNAGLDVLRGGDPINGTITTVTVASGPLAPNNLKGGGQESLFQVTVNDSFIIQSTTLQLNIQHDNVPDLEARLIAPDGTEVKLFTKVGGGGQPPRANFSNTVFDDNATTPIQLGQPPYSVGPFKPQTPLSDLNGKGSDTGNKIYTLAIKNNGNTVGTLTDWLLNFKKIVSGTGLGEAVADQFTASFKIFTQDPANGLSTDVWTPIGPAAENYGENSGRVSALAVDPSDPSGNTVYAGGATGGVWKTTNFLTTERRGPIWVPLTDLGPTFSLNVSSIAVFGRNNDPNQSRIFVGTGEGNVRSPGVGFLFSPDGGLTWKVLDSTNNAGAGGAILPINDPARDHLFVGAIVYKVVADPTPLPNGEVVLYAAIEDPNPPVGNSRAGVWRSVNTGRSWQLLHAGNATDVVLAPGSKDATGNLQTLYAAFLDDGVYKTNNATTATTMSGLTGAVGHPIYRDLDGGANTEIPVTGVGTVHPNGARGRVSLATPALADSPLENVFYQRWLYALVGNGDLYLTKDAGDTWTKVHIPGRPNPPFLPTPTNNETQPNFSATVTSYAQAIAVDPANPNIVYLGGSSLMRVDVTKLSDPYALVAYDNSDPDGGSTQLASTGPISVKPFPPGPGPGAPYGLLVPNNPFAPPRSPYLNLLRDPDEPFLAPSTMRFTNVARFNNEGTDISWSHFNAVVDGFSAQHHILTQRDPLTGKTRLLVANDAGVFSGVDAGDGTLHQDIGAAVVTSGARSGNLQLIQLYYGAVQPSILAADLAGALYYGMSHANGFPQSTKNILGSGYLDWTWPNFTGSGTGVATDQTGGGHVFQYRWPFAINEFPFLPQDFFLIKSPGVAPFSRTQGLIQTGNDVGGGQWPGLGQPPNRQLNVGNFASNPLDPRSILISSQAGRVFRTIVNNNVTLGDLVWEEIGVPSHLGNSGYAPALAFGAPQPSDQDKVDNFIYAGTIAGRIFVTFTGGGTASNTWTNISAGLDGSPVVAISTNPKRGSREAYALTERGVYHLADSAAPGATWERLSDVAGKGVLLTLTRPMFNDNTEQIPFFQAPTAPNPPPAGPLLSLAVDWRFAVPADPAVPVGPNNTTNPVLYVGGHGGVVRSRDKGESWTVFPNIAPTTSKPVGGKIANGDAAPQQGGYLPLVTVTDLDLALGNINKANGFPEQSTGLNMLVATTFGRGAFAIRLDNEAIKQFAVVPFTGPRILTAEPKFEAVPPGTSRKFTKIIVTFQGVVDPVSFTPDDVVLTAPNGSRIDILMIRDITAPPPGQPNKHNVYELSFAPQTSSGVYNVAIGPNISDFAGNKMDQDQDGVLGESPDDIFTAQYDLFKAPTISSIPNQTIQSNSSTGPLPFTIGDAETPPNELIVSGSSSNQVLVPNTNIVFGGSGANRTVTVTPATNQKGVAQITITVTDEHNQSTSTMFTLTVQNQGPNLNPIPNQVIPHPQDSKNITLTFSDPETDPLTFSAETQPYQLPFNLDQQLGLSNPGNNYYEGGNNIPGAKYLVANDGNYYYLVPNGSGEVDFRRWAGFSGGQHTQNPLIAILTLPYHDDPALVHDAVLATPSVGYTFTPNPTPSGATTNNLNVNPPSSVVGTFVVRATASDGTASDSEFFLFSVRNNKPTLDQPANQSMKHSDPSIQVTLVAHDQDAGETLTFSAVARAYKRLFELDQALGLSNPGNNYYEGGNGIPGAKYLVAADGNYYYLVKNAAGHADLRLYQGFNGGQHTQNKFIEELPGSVHTNPALLHDAISPSDPQGIVLTLNPQSAVVVGGQASSQLTIDPPSTFVGAFEILAGASDGAATGQKTFFVDVSNNAPNLAQPANVVMPHTQDTAQVNVSATDDNGETISFSAAAQAYTRPYELDQALGLSNPGNNYYEGGNGIPGAKYLVAADGNWYYLFKNANGEAELRRYAGFNGGQHTQNPLIEVLPGTYHEKPSRLHDAPVPSNPPPIGFSFNPPQGTVVANQPVNSILTINPPHAYANTFVARITASDGVAASNRFILVTVTNKEPALEPVNWVEMSHTQDSTNATLNASDQDTNEVLKFSAAAQAYNRPFELDQAFGLKKNPGSDNYFLGGNFIPGAKYLEGSDGNWYFLRLNNDNRAELRRWDGAVGNPEGNALIEILPKIYYDLPSLLHDATPGTVPAGLTLTPNPAQATVDPQGKAQSNLNINPPAGYAGTFTVVAAVTDDIDAASRSFLVTVRNLPPELAPIPDQSMPHQQDQLQVQLTVTQGDNDPLTFKVELFGYSLAYELDQKYGLFFAGSYYQNFHGQQEKWMRGSGGAWYCIKPNGDFHAFDPNAGPNGGIGQKIATLTPAYWENPALLHDAAPPGDPPMEAAPKVDPTIDPTKFILTLNPDDNFIGRFRVRVSVSDGITTSSREFFVDVT